MLERRRLRDHDHAVLAQEPGERDLRRTGAVPRGDLNQGTVAENAALLERGIRHDRDPPLAAPRDQLVLRAAAAEVEEDLVGGDGFSAGYPDPFLHVARFVIFYALLG